MSNGTPIIVMMCGIAGAGKTTYAQELEKDGYVRLSIDEEIWASHGRYGIDYLADQYPEYLIAAEKKLRHQLVELVRDRKNVVIDFSFWQRTRRDEYKQVIRNAGGEWRLIYLKVSPDVLRKRLAIRSHRFDANAAFPITEDILNSYLKTFEEPSDEGETVLEL